MPAVIWTPTYLWMGTATSITRKTVLLEDAAHCRIPEEKWDDLMDLPWQTVPAEVSLPTLAVVGMAPLLPPLGPEDPCPSCTIPSPSPFCCEYCPEAGEYVMLREKKEKEKEKEKARCPYCGSTEEPQDDMWPYQDWPRCPDCHGC